MLVRADGGAGAGDGFVGALVAVACGAVALVLAVNVLVRTPVTAHAQEVPGAADR